MLDDHVELVIFDADGTLRYVTVPGQHYPTHADEWRLMPGVREKLRALSQTRLRFGIASNQHGVALGLLTHAQAKELLRATWLAAVGPNGPSVTIEMCVCLPDAPCERRKPRPGMLLTLIEKHRLRPSQVLYVGDLAIDERAAASAGVRFESASTFFRS